MAYYHYYYFYWIGSIWAHAVAARPDRGAAARRMRRATATAVARRAHVAVVGAGVGGVAACGALVAAGANVTWLDPSFDSGAFARYSDVPANTKLSLLVPHFEQLMPQGVPDGAVREALDRLVAGAFPIELAHDPDGGRGWCQLGAVADVLQAMTEAVLLRRPDVQREQGRVVELRQLAGAGADGGGWAVSWERADGATAQQVRVDAVVLSTGCVPTAAPEALLPGAWAGASATEPVRVIPLEEALSLSSLRAHCAAAGGGVVGVVGGGHSGLVVARALLALPEVEAVRLFVRRPLRLAAWDGAAGKYGAWGFRGLKGGPLVEVGLRPGG